MMSIYQKTANLSNYIRDIMYLMKYNLDIFSSLYNTRTANGFVTPVSHGDTMRSYKFSYNNPNVEGSSIHASIMKEYEYSFDYILTLTSSYAHVSNNMKSTTNKYHYVLSLIHI